MSNEATKIIKILTSGPITIKSDSKNPYAKASYIWGPVLTPYSEKTSTIFNMLASGVKIVEVINGEEVELTIQNYQSNNADAKAKKEAEAKAKKDAAEAMKAKKEAEAQAKKDAAEAERLAKEAEAKRLKEYEESLKIVDAVDEVKSDDTTSADATQKTDNNYKAYKNNNKR